MLTALLSILIIILAFPIGYLLARACKEEIIGGRRGFLTLYLASIVIAIIVAFLKINREIKISIIFSLIFIAIVSFMALWLSYSKKFVYSSSK